MADSNSAYSLGYQAYRADKHAYFNPYQSYGKFNSYNAGWNAAREEDMKAIPQLSTAPKAEASAAEAVSPLRPVFAWFVRDVRTGGVIAGFLTERDAADFWGEFCSCDYEVTEI